MRKEISALLDGEQESHEPEALLAALRHDPALREAWLDYCLIGDALRGEMDLSCDIADRVMTNLREVPTVLAPQAIARRSWQQPALALAASAAGVAVVAWMALGSQFGAQPEPQLAVAGKPSVTVERQTQLTAGRENMQEYLAAHQAHASSLHLQGGTQHIRTVAAIGPVASAK